MKRKEIKGVSLKFLRDGAKIEAEKKKGCRDQIEGLFGIRVTSLQRGCQDDSNTIMEDCI